MGEGYVGSPAAFYLRQFGLTVYEAFGDFPYLVGSALRTRNFRDVDVRLILDDDKFEQLIGEITKPRHMNLRWNAFCVAFSAYGTQTTGLPIDFQIDQQTYANEKYPGRRSALGITLKMAYDSKGRELNEMGSQESPSNHH